VTDHISFDGQEYESIEAMPPAVRAAYRDPYRKARQTGSRVMTIALGLFVVGSIGLGVWALWLLDSSALEQGSNFSVGPGYITLVVVTAIVGIALAVWIMVLKKRDPAKGVTAALGALDRVEGVAARGLQILLGAAAGGVVAGGYWMISNMDASSRSQAGDVYVGIGVLVALACIAAMYVSIEMRLKK
jgi:hypothetical protein